LESRDQYLPQIVAGAGLGESWGFPLSLEGSAPSIFNVNAQSALFNPALRSFVKSAKEDSKAARLQAQDQREQVMQDTVLTYAELVKWQSMLAQLQESEAEAAKAVGLINERVQSGVTVRWRPPRQSLQPLKRGCNSPRQKEQPTFCANISRN